VLLGTILYVTALYITTAVVQHRLSVFDKISANLERQNLLKYFGTLPETMLSLYQCITGGMDWGNALEPLREEIGQVTTLPFAIYIAFSVLVLLNVITGVFVESALKNTKEDKESVLIKHMRKLFLEEGGDFKSTISYNMLIAELEKPAMREYFKALDVDPSEAEKVFKLIDVDESGTVTADEFLTGSLALSGSARALDIEVLKQESRHLARDMDNASYLLELVMERVDALTRHLSRGADRAKRKKASGSATVSEASPGLGRQVTFRLSKYSLGAGASADELQDIIFEQPPIPTETE